MDPCLDVGRLSVRLGAPKDAPKDASGRTDSDERIFFWWGLTASALALARTLEARDDLAGRRVIELGCGLGLPGVVAGLRGGRVWFTDYHAEALSYARRNASANGLGEDRATFSVLDWEASPVGGVFDVVLGAEILYDYNMHPALLMLIPKLLAADGILLLADRRRLVVERFMGRLRDRGFGGACRDHSVTLPGESPSTASVFTWHRSGPGSGSGSGRDV